MRSTCCRCRAKPATNGVVCVACSARKHAWDGDAHESTCRVCGVKRYKRRKRTKPGMPGSNWQTWYDMQPDEGPPNKMPPCR